ncbi:MAG: sensor histidine kinase [Rhodospirillales bacterium]|jgi:signal transduction histidine kinase
MRSLRLRFAAVALTTALVCGGSVGAAVQGMFERHIEREALAELDADLRFLARGVIASNGGMLSVEPLPDPRFLEPFSGLYWQVQSDRLGVVLRSPSLAGAQIALPEDILQPNELHRHVVLGPEGGKMIVLERRLAETSGYAGAARVAVAIDRKVLEAANQAFVRDLLPALLAITAGLLAAFAVQGAVALHPIAKARAALDEIRTGRRGSLAGAVPSELSGLASDFDALLAAQRRQVAEARARAGDLAHGLRTPLAVLNARARDLRARGQDQTAAEIEAVTAGMEVRLGRELARVQIRGPRDGMRGVDLRPVAERLARALARTRRGEELTWHVEAPDGLCVHLDEGDLNELLGALLENAAKWATRQVRVLATRDGSTIVLDIEDDGPGIPPQHRRAALTRGVRLDPTRSGTGLGLAIASDLVAAYRGELSLEDGRLGGLRVRVTLPAAS